MGSVVFVLGFYDIEVLYVVDKMLMDVSNCAKVCIDTARWMELPGQIATKQDSKKYG